MFLTRMICFGVIPVVGKRLPLSQLCWLMAVPSVVMDLHILFLLLVRWLVFRPKEETTIGWAGNCGGGIRESAILVACVRRRLYFQKWCLPSLEAGDGGSEDMERVRPRIIKATVAQRIFYNRKRERATQPANWHHREPQLHCYPVERQWIGIEDMLRPAEQIGQ